MLNFIIGLLDGTGSTDHDEEARRVRFATATLLVRAATIDGHADNAELARLHELLADRFELSGEEVIDLIANAMAEERDAVDLFRYTNILNKSLDTDGRRALVEMLWEVAYADGRLDEYEANLVWRVAELIGIDSAERIRIRQKVAARAKSGQKG